MARAKTKRFSKNRLVLYLVVVILLVIGGFILYTKQSAASNKKNFQDARTTIDNIYYDARKQIGPADNAQISSSCSKTYKEFSGYRDLTCEVDTKYIYGVNSESEANILLEQTGKLIHEHIQSLELQGEEPRSLRDYLVVDSTYHTASTSYRFRSLSCTVNYVFDTPREIDLAIKDTSKKPFEIIIGCSGPAKQQYYRLAS